MSFGDRLFRLRKERGLTLRELAERVGMDHSLLSKIENDLRPDPETDLLFAIVDALHEVRRVPDEEVDALIAEAKRLTPDRVARLRTSRSLMAFLRRKP